MTNRNPFETLREDPFEDDDEGRTGAPDDSAFTAPAWRTIETVMPATVEQIERRGYAVWTNPTASLEADRRARDASRLEAGYEADAQSLTREHSSAYARDLDRRYRGDAGERGW